MKDDYAQWPHNSRTKQTVQKSFDAIKRVHLMQKLVETLVEKENFLEIQYCFSRSKS